MLFYRPVLDPPQLYAALQLHAARGLVTVEDTVALAYLLGAVDCCRLHGELTSVPEVEHYHLMLRRVAHTDKTLSLLPYCREGKEAV